VLTRQVAQSFLSAVYVSQKKWPGAFVQDQVISSHVYPVLHSLHLFLFNPSSGQNTWSTLSDLHPVDIEVPSSTL